MAGAMPRMSAPDRKYRAESDCRTLMDADDIQRDRTRHRLAKREAGKKVSSYRRIAGRKR